MGQRKDCPECGFRQSASKLDSQGCWYCSQLAQQAADDARFAEFMQADEEQRWRRLWESVGCPNPY